MIYIKKRSKWSNIKNGTFSYLNDLDDLGFENRELDEKSFEDKILFMTMYMQ